MSTILLLAVLWQAPINDGTVMCRNPSTGEVKQFMWVCPAGWIQL